MVCFRTSCKSYWRETESYACAWIFVNSHRVVWSAKRSHRNKYSYILQNCWHIQKCILSKASFASVSEVHISTSWYYCCCSCCCYCYCCSCFASSSEYV